MRKTLNTLVFIALIGAIGYIYMTRNGYNIDAILNRIKTIELKTQCSSVENLLITSVAEVAIINVGSRNHRDVTVRVTAYDSNNNIVKEKNILFPGTIEAKEQLSKPITLPAKAKTCKCVIENSNPN